MSAKFDPPAVRTHKTCPKCQTRLPLSSFDRCSSMPDGRLAYCHSCKLAYDRRRRRKLKPPVRRRKPVSPEAREAIEQSPKRKVCRGCKERKRLRLFPVVPRASGAPATAARCKACMVERVSAHRRKVKER